MEIYASRRAVLQGVFARPAYTLLALAIALFFYTLNALILQWKNLGIVAATNALSLFTVGVYYLTTRLSFYSLLLVSLLTGMLISLLVYRAQAALRLQRLQSRNASIVSSFGVFAGVLLPGCASCGIGLAALLGLSSSLALLPLQGLEISLAAIVLLCIALRMVAQSMTLHTACKIPQKKC